MTQKPRFFTGITATGTLTLGHYLGVIRHILRIQDDYEIIVMIADLHALTVPKPNFDYQKKCYEIASLLYACGLKKENCKIFIQSEVKEHLELSWILSSFTTVGELSNMIQYKEKKKNEETGNLALFSYPVLMASDILLYDANLVIVGQDQKQHLELTRALAKKINSFVETELLKLPRLSIPNLGAKIMGLKNPEKKMSKSERDYISLLDGPETIGKKIATSVTDSENKIYYQPKKKPGISNLLVIYGLLNNQKIEELEKEFSEIDYHQFKLKIINLLNKLLGGIQEKYNQFLPTVGEILENNGKYFRYLAKEKMSAIKKKLKLSRT